MILYKYKSSEHIEDIIVNKRLYCSKYDLLNDPMEWAFTSDADKAEMKKLIEDVGKDKWRICCLSKREHYGLMWSVYGAEHKGVCVEVEIDEKDYIKYDAIGQESAQPDIYYGNVCYGSIASKINGFRNDIIECLWKNLINGSMKLKLDLYAE